MCDAVSLVDVGVVERLILCCFGVLIYYRRTYVRTFVLLESLSRLKTSERLCANLRDNCLLFPLEASIPILHAFSILSRKEIMRMKMYPLGLSESDLEMLEQRAVCVVFDCL